MSEMPGLLCHSLANKFQAHSHLPACPFPSVFRALAEKIPLGWRSRVFLLLGEGASGETCSEVPLCSARSVGAVETGGTLTHPAHTWMGNAT